MVTRKPSAVSGTSRRISFICTSNFIEVFARIHSTKFLGFLTPIPTLGFCYVAPPRRARFPTCAVVVVVSLGVTLRGKDTLPDVPGDVRFGAASEEAAGTAAVPVSVAVGLSVPLDLLTSE
jgi:hypothetical protein